MDWDGSICPLCRGFLFPSSLLTTDPGKKDMCEDEKFQWMMIQRECVACGYHILVMIPQYSLDAIDFFKGERK